MRIRNNPNAKKELLECKKYIDSAELLQEILNKKENENKKIYLEIGMGKGTFISKKAQEDKENIYIGIEVCLPVLAIGIKKLKRFEEENNIMLDNLYLVSFDASTLTDVFKENQIEGIYLNFSDPWPKKKHEKRRLTYETFLNVYKQILKTDKFIEFKTDNRNLFEYSIISMQNFGFKFNEIYLDLHKENIDNIMTEYEEKFCKLGPIYKLVVQNIK